VCSACRQAPPPDRRSLEARNIRDLEAAWNRDFTRLDVESLVSRYTDDAVLALLNVPPASGTQAIRTAWKNAVQDGSFSMRRDTARVEVARSGDLAYSEGSYTATASDAVTGQDLRETGTYAIVYRRTSARMWKAVMDTFQRSAPPVPR
jgi:ketosteroid isomerase-like protein